MVGIGAKVPADIRKAIEKIAKDDQRTISQVISRLLVSHPALKKERIIAKI